MYIKLKNGQTKQLRDVNICDIIKEKVNCMLNTKLRTVLILGEIDVHSEENLRSFKGIGKVFLLK